MTVKHVKGGYATVHCHGKDKGKIIHKFKTKKQALAQHRAIMAPSIIQLLMGLFLKGLGENSYEHRSSNNS